MFKANGVELSARQYFLLKDLVDARRRGEDEAELAYERLHPDGDDWFNASVYHCYEKFFEEGFFYGEFDVCMGAKDKRFHLSPAGIDFVDDIEISNEIEMAQTKDKRRHDYKVAAFGAVVGGVIGLFSGAFGGAFLADWAGAAFAPSTIIPLDLECFVAAISSFVSPPAP